MQASPAIRTHHFYWKENFHSRFYYNALTIKVFSFLNLVKFAGWLLSVIARRMVNLERFQYLLLTERLKKIEFYTPEKAIKKLDVAVLQVEAYSKVMANFEGLWFLHNLTFKHWMERNMSLIYQIERQLRNRSFSNQPGQGKRYEYIDALTAIGKSTPVNNA